MKLAVILFNLGGPDSPEAVEPFLRNLFSDPAIISLPAIVRLPLARFIARRRAPIARKIYDHIGGRSPIFEETRTQADALAAALSGDGVEAKCFVAMRCWHPFSDGAARAVKAFDPDKIVLLPLYPQYSTTTTASSLKDWARAAKKAGLAKPTSSICCYPDEAGFVAAAAAHIRDTMEGAPTRCQLSPAAVSAWPAQAHHRKGRSLSMAGGALGGRHRRKAGHAGTGAGGLLPEPGRAAGMDRAQHRCGNPAAPAPMARAWWCFPSPLSVNIPKPWSSWISNMPSLRRRRGVKDYRRAPTVGAEPQFIAGLANPRPASQSPVRT